MQEKEVSLTDDLKRKQEGLMEDRDQKAEQQIEEAIDTMR